MKIALYCQNVLGVGHLSRSINLARELVTKYEVHLIQGGPKVGLTLNHPHFHHHYLEALLMNLEGELYSPSKEEVSKVWIQRRNELEAIGIHPFDFIIIEFFPFGRYQFKEEVLRFIESQRRLNPKCKVICSMRDIYTIKNKPEKVIKRARYSAEALNKYFDLLLIHSDPNIVRFEESFSYTYEIKIPIKYTGYIAAPKEFYEEKMKNEILVSTGGGSWGDELLSSIEKVAPDFPNLSFHIFQSALGPALKAQDILNVHYHSFNEREFKKLLARASLSISLAGYNTVVEALRYKTPMLLWPFMFNNEQPTRARVLEQHSLARILSPKQTLEEQLRLFLRRPLNFTSNQNLPKLDGALETISIINALANL